MCPIFAVSCTSSSSMILKRSGMQTKNRFIFCGQKSSRRLLHADRKTQENCALPDGGRLVVARWPRSAHVATQLGAAWDTLSDSGSNRSSSEFFSIDLACRPLRCSSPHFSRQPSRLARIEPTEAPCPGRHVLCPIASAFLVHSFELANYFAG